MSSNIGDLITADVSATSNQVDATAAATVADKALADANAAKTSADASLASGLKNFPNGVFSIDTAGAVTVYLADATPAGFHTIQPAPVSATLPDPPPTPVNPS